MSSPACAECRTRKLKCSRDLPSCSFCSKHHKSCDYSPKKQRAPLTRAYVSGLEKRIQHLEKLLRGVQPDLDLAEAIPENKDLAQHHLTSVFSSQDTLSESPNLDIAPTRPTTPDSLPASYRGFDWYIQRTKDAENVNCAEPNSDPGGVGYLGKFTNVALLRTLQKIDWLWRNAPLQQPYPQPQAEQPGCIPLSAIEGTDSNQGFADFLVDAYFKHFHTTYPIVHEATFRAQFSEVLPRPTKEAWLVLSRSVLSIGAWCTGHWISNGDGRDPADCLQIFEHIDLLRMGCLTMAQGLTLLACFLDKQSKSNIASIYFAAAVKMALSLGLNRELPDWDISLLERELRRRVWWCLFVLESGQSMAMGRPILLPSTNAMDIRLPLNIPEQALTSRSKTEPKNLSVLTIYSNLRAQVEFHLMINDTYNRCINGRDVQARHLLDLDSRIDRWLDALPLYLHQSSAPSTALPRLSFAPCHLLWRVRCLKNSLFFPFLARLARPDTVDLNNSKSYGNWHEAVRACVDCAHTIVSSIEEFYSNEKSDSLRDWYARYGLVQSALVFILVIHSNFQSVPECKSIITADLEKTAALLAKVSNQDRLPKIILDILGQMQTRLDQDHLDEAATWFLEETFETFAPSFDTQSWIPSVWDSYGREP